MTQIHSDHFTQVYASPLMSNLSDLAQALGARTETLVNQAQRTFKAQHRQWEWLTIRAMLQETLGPLAQISYTPQGRPFLRDSKLHISISHTKTQAALLLSRHQNVGLDIEQLSERILKLQHRIAQPRELPENFEQLDQATRIKHLTELWTIKESIFKSLPHQQGVNLLSQITKKPHSPNLALFDGKEIVVQTHLIDNNILSFVAYSATTT